MRGTSTYSTYSGHVIDILSMHFCVYYLKNYKHRTELSKQTEQLRKNFVEIEAEILKRQLETTRNIWQHGSTDNRSQSYDRAVSFSQKRVFTSSPKIQRFEQPDRDSTNLQLTLYGVNWAELISLGGAKRAAFRWRSAIGKVCKSGSHGGVATHGLPFLSVLLLFVN